MMKKFEQPKFLVVEFSVESILTTSQIESKNPKLYETGFQDILDGSLDG